MIRCCSTTWCTSPLPSISSEPSRWRFCMPTSPVRFSNWWSCKPSSPGRFCRVCAAVTPNSFKRGSLGDSSTVSSATAAGVLQQQRGRRSRLCRRLGGPDPLAPEVGRGLEGVDVDMTDRPINVHSPGVALSQLHAAVAHRTESWDWSSSVQGSLSISRLGSSFLLTTKGEQ